MADTESRTDRRYRQLTDTAQAQALAQRLFHACAEDLLSAGIPVQPDKVTGIALTNLRNTRACCYFRTAPDGQMVFRIALSRRLIGHLSDEIVVKHVKNSMYHELLHTCPGCQDHGSRWMHWSEVCDRVLHTHTRRHMEADIYYNTCKNPPKEYHCPHCGGHYLAAKPLQEPVRCALCRHRMEGL